VPSRKKRNQRVKADVGLVKRTREGNELMREPPFTSSCTSCGGEHPAGRASVPTASLEHPPGGPVPPQRGARPARAVARRPELRLSSVPITRSPLRRLRSAASGPSSTAAGASGAGQHRPGRRRSRGSALLTLLIRPLTSSLPHSDGARVLYVSAGIPTAGASPRAPSGRASLPASFPGRDRLDVIGDTITAPPTGLPSVYSLRPSTDSSLM